jgi:hypothetical protein
VCKCAGGRENSTLFSMLEELEPFYYATIAQQIINESMSQ